jgi:hypothetical protein
MMLGIKEKNRPHGAMMGWGMVLGEVVAKVGSTWCPEDFELVLV